jgi:S1-C subfamily serine protease
MKAFAIALVCCVFVFDSNGPAIAWSTSGSAAAGESRVKSLKDYLDARVEPIEIAQLGILGRDDRANLEDGEQISGVAVVDLSRGDTSVGGLKSEKAPRDMMTGVLLGAEVAATILCPPVMLGFEMFVESRLGKSWDLIVAVDGYRVTNTFELIQAVQDTQPGDRVYLAIVRKRQRMQIDFRVP